MYGGGLATALEGGRLQRAGREARRRVAVRQRQHRARQRLLLLAVALPAALRDGHRAATNTVALGLVPQAPAAAPPAAPT